MGQAVDGDRRPTLQTGCFGAGGVLWAALGPNPQVVAGLTAWARTLALDGLSRLSDVAELSRHLARHLADKRMLLIVDDVWDERDAIPFVVGGHGCAHLITTRLPRVAEALAPTPEAIYRLPVLGEESALELLRTLAPGVVRDHPVECRELVRELEGLPLALQVAGHLLQAEARLGWDVADLLAELRSGLVLLRQDAPPDLVDLASQTIPTVAVLLKRSTGRLDASTRDCFALLGVFPSKPATFDLEALGAVWEVPDPRSTVRVLVDRGLLEPVGEGRFQMHALLVLHARALLTE